MSDAEPTQITGLPDNWLVLGSESNSSVPDAQVVMPEKLACIAFIIDGFTTDADSARSIPKMTHPDRVQLLGKLMEALCALDYYPLDSEGEQRRLDWLANQLRREEDITPKPFRRQVLFEQTSERPSRGGSGHKTSSKRS